MQTILLVAEDANTLFYIATQNVARSSIQAFVQDGALYKSSRETFTRGNENLSRDVERNSGECTRTVRSTSGRFTQAPGKFKKSRSRRRDRYM